MLVPLPCQHQYCPSCLKQLTKITRIKKNAAPLTEMLEGEEPLKCPKCLIVHIVGPEEHKMYEEIIKVEELKKEEIQRP